MSAHVCVQRAMVWCVLAAWLGVCRTADAADAAEPVEHKGPRARLVPESIPAEEKPVQREADAALAKLYREAAPPEGRKGTPAGEPREIF